MIIYKATNIENGKVYIGATTLPLKTRIRNHIRFAKREDRKRGYFQEALMKYGPDKFIFAEIDQANTKEEMYEKEDEWISFYKSTDSRYGYNLNTGGISGKKQESTKNKIGKTTKERWKNTEISSKMRDGLRKGTEIWKKLCYDRRVLFICPECGKELYLAPYETKNKRYCSKECAKKAGVYRDIAIRNSKNNAILNHKRNIERKVEIKKRYIGLGL